MEHKEQILYRENSLTAGQYRSFQREMGWPEEAEEVLTLSLANIIYSVTAEKGGQLIGMGRLVGDRAMYWYIQDVFILREYQGKGIGTEIVRRLIAYVERHAAPGSEYSIFLMSAKGKEGFYERLGFRSRPDDRDGAGMELTGRAQERFV